ncbi:DUF1257 domain-containing protein [Aneurinibacillus aneurinilyticus]|jgi:hypothetical protein|uniref:DUF1257 domain-containing protein n=1 Tax=Aneurinibacillus aneurinilyticus ATCC 12856 TaxID=649747 RepID=U1YC52_ANEAE|nr:DUF1257 domain-containing protein [Aneurinibacillus aneurinilyticus]ERI09677.1 hypothetical protein HMPREF0083_02248 [Aneurinibacillus aneurinilyticus ATCC 12856]MCI1693390.1 DUF1257 domain-containing protein [Aneurinibacillus aneurinilyticus]MED0707196.1 DUF1257 domain-containing protein [Aneurinibacillus aneurinilyticus]MED0726525.1 DUF1257 domain-containing protein [Aneurinibacillus aneurinilyticus]MED0735205.1 DUF1257 domain-containing protein [Aneurinibacillus aneurinilyticus]
MSIEIVLIPLAIALTKEIAEGISNYTDNNRNDHVVIETRMKDESLLKQALGEWSCSFRHVETLDFLESINENEVTFLLNEEGCYSLVLPESADRGAYIEWINDVEKSYTHYLQQSVYQNLMEKAKRQGMILEQEEVLEDNSIQVTYILNR